MNFTYASYCGLLEKLKNKKYYFASYNNWNAYGRCVIMRHDIDYDIEKAVRLAEIEHRWGG